MAYFGKPSARGRAARAAFIFYLQITLAKPIDKIVIMSIIYNVRYRNEREETKMKIYCRECGEELVVDEVIEESNYGWGANRTVGGHCPKCEKQWTWSEAYDLVLVEVNGMQEC